MKTLEELVKKLQQANADWNKAYENLLTYKTNI